MQLGPIFAAPYQLSADEGSESDTYARASNPGWRGLESALAALEMELQGIYREPDYAFFLHNTVGAWRVWALGNGAGGLDGFFVARFRK